MSAEKIQVAVKAVEDKYDANIFIYSAPIDNTGFGKLVKEVAKKKSQSPRPNGLLILTTNGGVANSAYKIARLMQQTYSEFVLFTPSICKSAGTLIALGANRIVMDVFSELGPLDVQLLDRDEIGARKSGLLTRSAFEALSEEAFQLFSRTMFNIKVSSQNLISFKLASDISWRLTGELLSPVFGQMNPDVIGSDFRDLQVATEYGNRLAKSSRNPKSDTVRKLVSDYPSHDFIIDREEAEELFENVDLPSEELYDLLQLLSGVIYRQASPPIVKACSSTEDSEHEKDEDGQNATDNTSDTSPPMAESGSSDRKRDRRSRPRKRSARSEGQQPAATAESGTEGNATS